MRLCALAVAALFAWALPAAGQPGPALTNPGFEEAEEDGTPVGWQVTSIGHAAGVVRDGAPEGEGCGQLATTAGASGPGVLLQTIDAAAYRGSRIELSAMLRHEGRGGRTQMWLRVDRPLGEAGFFDNMSDRPVTKAEWDRYSIVGDVGDDAETITVGLMLVGGGRGLIDGVTLRILGVAGEGDQPARELDGRGLRNLAALARLIGFVRHFHPSDEAAGADWHRFALRAIDAVEDAGTDAELAERLRGLFAPVAPLVAVWAGGEDEAPPPAPAPEGAAAVLRWEHRGFGQDPDTRGAAYQVYQSKRARLALGDARAGAERTLPLAAGLWCRLPLTVPTDGTRTMPEGGAEVDALPLARPEGWIASGNDRGTRLANVILGWNILQHFYPYFDVIETAEWEGALELALREAAADEDQAAFTATLRRLVGKIHDGHGRASGPTASIRSLPLSWDWAGEELVVTDVLPVESGGPEGLERGDVVLAIDGTPVADLYERVSPLISAATPQWRRWRALTEIRTLGRGPAALRVRKPDGREAEVAAARVEAGMVAGLGRPRPKDGEELADGILYFNLDRTERKALQRHLPALAAAKGVVFDMRGYPGDAGSMLLPYLSDRVMTSARWMVPLFLEPGGVAAEHDRSNWTLHPQRPRIGGAVAFVTDGRAISYAESCMGIVEYYRLGEIVGGATAGCNGNVCSVRLPGGYSFMFTGMKVLKHDGSQHHGVGILPTVAVEPTPEGIAAGRDEVLEKAVEVLRAKIAEAD